MPGHRLRAIGCGSADSLWHWSAEPTGAEVGRVERVDGWNGWVIVDRLGRLCAVGTDPVEVWARYWSAYCQQHTYRPADELVGAVAEIMGGGGGLRQVAVRFVPAWDEDTDKFWEAVAACCGHPGAEV